MLIINYLLPLQQVKLLFTQSLIHGFIPASFKRATIIPVFKSGKKKHVIQGSKYLQNLIRPTPCLGTHQQEDV